MIDEQWEFLQDLIKLLLFIKEKGFKATGGELWRNKEIQTYYVNTGKSKTMNSLHLDRLAIDLNIFDKENKLINDKSILQPIGDYWEGLNSKNKWGGNFKVLVDLPHFERRRL